MNRPSRLRRPVLAAVAIVAVVGAGAGAATVADAHRGGTGARLQTAGATVSEQATRATIVWRLTRPGADCGCTGATRAESRVRLGLAALPEGTEIPDNGK